MGGHSGTRTASHTPIVERGGNRFAITPAQMRLLEKARSINGSVLLTASEKRSAVSLVLGGFGTLSDETLLTGCVFTIADGLKF